MSLWFYQRINAIAGWATIAAVFVLAIVLANIEIKDLDLWLHLATGKFILYSKTIPYQDIFSFSLGPQPWLNHEWLFQVIVYATYHLFGFDGLSNLQVLLVTFTLLLLYFLGFARNRQLILSYTLFLVLLVFQTRFTIRPDLFSLLFLVIYLHVINFHLDKKESYWTLFLVQVLWVNIHGFFVLGPILILTYVMGEWIKRSVKLPFDWKNQGRFKDEELLRLYKMFFIVLAACLINPYGLEGLTYPFKVFLSLGGESKIFFKYISELQPPIEWQSFLSLSGYDEFKILIIFCALAFILNFRRMDFTQAVIAIFFLLFSLKAVRNIPFFAFISFFTVAFNSKLIPWQNLIPHQFNSEKARLVVLAMAQIALTCYILNHTVSISSNGYFDFEKLQRKSEFGGVSLRTYPVKAVNFLASNKIKGNFLNDFNSGAYLIGNLSPEVRVFIDGRTEVYGPAFFEEYRKAFDGDINILEKVLSQYSPTGVFLNGITAAVPKEVLKYFYTHQEWSLIYFDYDAVIFLKNIPENESWVNSLKVDLAQYRTKPMDLVKLGAMNVDPFEYVHRASNLFSIDLQAQALVEAEEALRIEPRAESAYKVLGQIFLEQKDYQKAFEHLRKAKILNPADKEIRYYLGVCYYHLDNLEKSAAMMELVLQGANENSHALSFLALIKAKQDDFDGAVELLKKIKRITGQARNTSMEVAKTMLEQNKTEYAKEVYQLLLGFNPNQPDVINQLKEIK